MTKELIKEYISLIDLTSLSSIDNEQTILDLVAKGNKGLEEISPAAYCVYSDHIKPILANKKESIKAATVAGYFPSGQSTIEQKIKELEFLNDSLVDEIDIVVNRGKILMDDYEYLSKEISLSKETIGKKCLKVILETGELNTEQIKRSSEVAIASGANFIKTSTGKSAIGATPEAVKIMCESIKQSGLNVGIKVSGGVRTFEDAELYRNLVEGILGIEWINKDRFRIGASSLFDNLIIDFNKL
jgi:deoxyribose-phosphate aldolase